MTTFDMATTIASGPDLADDCQCPLTGPTRPVLFSMDAGSVSVHCAICHRHITAELEELFAEDVPMAMTTVVEKFPADNAAGFEIGAVWHELTPAAEPELAEAFADLVDVVDRLRNIGGMGAAS